MLVNPGVNITAGLQYDEIEKLFVESFKNAKYRITKRDQGRIQMRHGWEKVDLLTRIDIINLALLIPGTAEHANVAEAYLKYVHSNDNETTVRVIFRPITSHFSSIRYHEEAMSEFMQKLQHAAENVSVSEETSTKKKELW